MLGPFGEGFNIFVEFADRDAVRRRALFAVTAGHRLAVDMKNTTAHRDLVSRQTNDPLDEGDGFILRLAKHDDVTARGVGGRHTPAERDNAKGEGIPGIAVGEFGDEKIVADLQCRDHGTGRDIERLEQERPEGQRQRTGDDDCPKRLEILVLLLRAHSPRPVPSTVAPDGAFAEITTKAIANGGSSLNDRLMAALYPSGVSLSSAVLQRPVRLTRGAP